MVGMAWTGCMGRTGYKACWLGGTVARTHEGQSARRVPEGCQAGSSHVASHSPCLVPLNENMEEKVLLFVISSIPLL